MMLNEYFPKKYIKIKSHLKNKNPKWITKGLKLSCLHKRMLRIMINHTNNNIIKKYYRQYRKILKRAIIISKKKVFIDIMNKAENKTKVMWKIVKEKTNKAPNLLRNNIK